MSLLRVSLRRITVSRTPNPKLPRGLFHQKPRTTLSFSTYHSADHQAKKALGEQFREEWSNYSQFQRASGADEFRQGQLVTVHGFLSRRRVKSSKLVFADIQIDNGPAIQITSSFENPDSPDAELTKAMRAIPLHTPVSVTGIVSKLHESPPPPGDGVSNSGLFPSGVTRVDINLEDIQALNQFPKDIIVSDGVKFPPKARHLQLRFSEALRSRLLARPQIGLRLRNKLNDLGFTEVETPILFKSTPEGAREFLVPTRNRALAYALPQSPQQYKQILMASGVRGYYQFARCFRDEDLRADRQPEFTQLDLEMSFATGKDVMRAVESLVSEIPAVLNAQFSMVKRGDDVYPVLKRGLKPTDVEGQDMQWPELSAPFPRLTYQDAMSRFGSDKPDLRIPFEIRRVDHALPSEFVSKITHLKNPIVEAFRFRPQLGQDGDVKTVAKFVDTLMDNLPAPLARHPDGAPTALIYDSTRPLGGLSSLGHEGVEGLTNAGSGVTDFQDLEDGDILFFQARQDVPFSGGSTALGTTRNHVYHQAVASGLLPRDFGFQFLWVTNFPMFTLDNNTDPGQGGRAGFSATHHPFTAPLTANDVELLATDPLKAEADHYDLVVNGVELGGGSRRIHVAKMQEYVMREILEMTDEGVGQFSHLLDALRAGCPPHAGFALGFDRLVAVFTHTNSVRDVIAFPKSMKGEDLMVGSPGLITAEQQKTYHLESGRNGVREAG
ncbi:aspartyl-tRNA synthetase-like protein [Schizothecium vesticola]|uniref:Aspartyl-tRNA synthetase-like protein n=1 Tax=Schizothecium vesticola TaxID=314040 RepID=A0AA40F9S5_9PEZI|nr:aspartyl-tRNA synthetase-like protein [Schizothecium vesticola]